MAYKNLDDLKDIQNKRILVRLDLNVPLEKDPEGGVIDDTRIRYALETLKELSEKGAKVIILSHLGRPQGITPSLSNRRLFNVLQRYWGNRSLFFIDDLLSTDAVSAIDSAPAGALFLGENIRFYKGEEENDDAFSKQIARLGDIYVNDGFSVSHRAHSSTVGITHSLPSYAGRLMEKELNALNRCLNASERPLMAIIGGAKVSTKLKILHNLLEKVDYLVIGGGMANTFLFAQGLNVGQSLCEAEKAEEAKEILRKVHSLNKQCILPVDVVVKNDQGQIRTIPATAVADNDSILDSGPESTKQIKNALHLCKTVLWNGPVGLFEVPPFDTATLNIARDIADCTKAGQLQSIAGGGETIAGLNKAGREKDFTFVSMAGGAFLEWLEGIPLPGIEALKK